MARDVAIVGAGIVGLSIAHRAAREGMSVAVYDRDPAAAASTVAAGMLAPVTEAEFGNPELLELGLAAAERWPAFAAELGVELRTTGTLLVARDRDEAEALEREHAFRERLGLRVERLRPTAARRLEPALAPTIRLALHAPDDHAVDPRAVLAALADGACQAGAEIHTGVEVGRDQAGELVVGGDAGGGERSRGEAGELVVAGRPVEATTVVIAAGAWSAALADVPVRPVKGQILRLRDPAGPGLLDRVLRFEGGYLVPRGDGRYVLGATVEERGFDTAVTAGGIYELLRDATELVPGISELEIEELTAGLRPGTPGNVPIVRREGRVVIATGHFRNGILLAPLTAEHAVATIAREAVRA